MVPPVPKVGNTIGLIAKAACPICEFLRRWEPTPCPTGMAGAVAEIPLRGRLGAECADRDPGAMLALGIWCPGPCPCSSRTQRGNRPTAMEFETVGQVPESLSSCDVRLDDETVSTARRHGNPDAEPRLVMSHGNSMAIDCHHPFWSLLAEDFDLAVHDKGSHGRNAVGRQQDLDIPTLIRDRDPILESIDGRFGSKPTGGAYHSLATLVSLLSFTGRHSALVLFDQPICRPIGTEGELDDALKRTAGRIRHRGRRFRWRGRHSASARRIRATCFVAGLRRTGRTPPELLELPSCPKWPQGLGTT